MTRVTFENATIRDVIGKAAKIAPTKGAAFDKSAGIHITIEPGDNEVLVRSNNTEVFYTEITEPIEIDGPPTTWLIPSVVLDGIVNTLPISSGSQVTFEDNGRQLQIAHKRMRARIGLLDSSYYQLWSMFEPEGLSPVSDFAARLQQVSWAAARQNLPPLSGIHLDGEHALATDQQRIAMVPCKAEMIYEPVTIPAATFTPLMKNLGEVRMGRNDNTLLVMPDEYTQIAATIYAGEYPNIKRVFKRDETNSIKVRREEIVEMVEQAKVMGQNDRNPTLKLIVGLEELAVMMEDAEMGLLGNVADLPGQCEHARHTIGVDPDSFTNALRAAPNQDVTIFYNLTKKPLRFDGGSGYEAIVTTKNLNAKKEAE